MNDEKMLLEQLMNLEWSAKYGYGIGGAVPVEHIGDDGFVFNAVIKQGSESNLRDMFNDSELITSAEFIKEVINNLEEKQNRINELTEFLSNYPEVTVFPRERNELLRLKEEVKFLNDIVDRFSLNVISIINKKSAQCDLNDYDNLKMANYAAREKVANLLDALIVLPKYDKVNKYLDLKRRLDNRMVVAPLLDEKIQELNDLLFSIRQDGINIPSNLKYDNKELEEYKNRSNPSPNPNGNDEWRKKAEKDWIDANEDAQKRHEEAEEARKEQEEIEKELEKERKTNPSPSPSPKPKPEPEKKTEPDKDDWRKKAEKDWIDASEDAQKRHEEAEEARKEQEEIEKELEKEHLQPSPNPNPQPTPERKFEPWKDPDFSDWYKKNRDAFEERHARKEQEEIDKQLERERQMRQNTFNMISGSFDMSNAMNYNNSAMALLSGIEPNDRTRVGEKVYNSRVYRKVVTKITSIPDRIADKIADKLNKRKINSKNPKVVGRMKNMRQKFRDKFTNGISFSDNNKVIKYYNEIVDLDESKQLDNALDYKPGYYRDICNFILNSGSGDLSEEDIKFLERVRDDAIEVVRTKYSGKGRS
jgi:hypothetical protein